MTAARTAPSLRLGLGTIRIAGFEEAETADVHAGLLRELASLHRQHGLPERVAGGSALALESLRIEAGADEDLSSALRRAAHSVFETLHGKALDLEVARNGGNP